LKSVSAIAPGKSILFGEHAVVYGYPAIATAISINSRCNIKEIPKDKISINLKNYDTIINGFNLSSLKSEIPSKYKQYGKCLQIMKNQFGIDLNNIEITLESDLFPGSGLGSSASLSVSLVFSINSFYELGLNKDKINKIAYELEKVIHGTPSGIDNTITTYGNAIFFQEGKFDFINLSKNIPLLITHTNIEHNTKEAINRIKDMKAKNPHKVQKILKNIGRITKEAKNELIKGNFEEIGELMSLNQKYLAELKVSNNKISQIVKISNENGAYGSKLTGAGLGGCVISIGEKHILEEIANILREKGFQSFLAKNDKKGVRLDKK